MRYPASEKLEIIRTVEASHLPVRRTLAMLGIPSSTYYDWYACWVEGGLDALADRSPRPRSVWNRIPEEIRRAVVEFALEHGRPYGARAGGQIRRREAILRVGIRSISYPQ